MKMVGWNVYLNGRLIDTVYYLDGDNSEEIKSTLVDHDGYNSRIVVKKQ